MRTLADPPTMPGTRESPIAFMARSVPLAGTPGAAYVEGRGIAVEVADAAGVRFVEECLGRPAVVAFFHDRHDTPRALHARFLHSARRENKMLTFGEGGGAISCREGWRADPVIVVEGLFDALSLATCGRSSVATIGRWAPWLPDVTAGRIVWIGFDGNRPGDEAATRVATALSASDVGRLRPPDRCKDWNTALARHGTRRLSAWLDAALGARPEATP